MPIKKTLHHVKTTNRDLSDSILRLEGRMDTQERVVKELKAEVAPLLHMMIEIKGGMRLIQWSVGLIGVAATVLEIVRALHR